MSLYEYRESQTLERQDAGFYGLIMAAMRRADTMNLEKLKSCWPDVWVEFKNRYNAPGGLLPGEVMPEAKHE